MFTPGFCVFIAARDISNIYCSFRNCERITAGRFHEYFSPVSNIY